MNGEALKKAGLFWYQGEVGVCVDPVKKVRLLVFVGRKDDIKYDSLEDLS